MKSAASSSHCAAGWRHVKVTDRHTAVDYANVLKELADIHFANVKTIVLVHDNLNIHSKASLYETFPAAEARRFARPTAATPRPSTRHLPWVPRASRGSGPDQRTAWASAPMTIWQNFRS